MKQLSHESRALLAEARRSERLSPADKARIRSNLTRRIGAGLAVGTALSATATVAEAAHTGAVASMIAWLPAVTKVVSVIAITSAVSVGVVKVTRPSSPVSRATTPVAVVVKGAVRSQPPTSGNAVVTNSTAVAPSEPSVAAFPESVPSAPPLNRTKRVLPQQTAASDDGMTSTRASDESDAPAERAVTDRLTDQVAAIRTARAAIRDGDPRHALAILDREMPEGRAAALAPEAALARVAAYCRLGQVDAARRTAEQFHREYPQSPLGARLRDSCAGANAAQP